MLGYKKAGQKIDWDKVWVFSPDWYKGSRNSQYTTNEFVARREVKMFIKDGWDSLTWYKGWSAKPKGYPENIFQFHVAFDKNHIFFRLVFLSQYSWYVDVVPSWKTFRKIRAKAEEYFY